MHENKQILINLVADVQNGVDGAFEKLYHETVKTAYAQAAMILKNPQDIEDVLQNSYMRVAENISELRKPESFDIWFSTIVKRECLKYTEKNSRVGDAFMRFRKIKESELLASEYALSDSVENSETRELVQLALGRISEKKRMCLVLYYFEQRSVAEISEITGIPEGTVLSRIYYARKSFENEFEKLRKKDERLLGVAAIPLLISVFVYQAENIAVPAAIESAVIASVSAGGAAASAVSTASTASAAATTAATSTAASTATATAAGGTAAAVATKIAAVAVAATVATGGGVAVVNHVHEKNEASTVQSLSSTVTEEHATVAAVYAESTTGKPAVTVSESSSYLSTALISEIHVSSEESEPEMIKTEKATENTATVVQTTRKQRISREYTLEAADTTASGTTVKPIETTTEKRTTATTEEETTEKKTTTKKETTTKKVTTTQKPTTTVKETTTQKPTTTAAPTTDASEVYGISGGVINEYTGSESKLVIPSKIGSSSVTAIGTSAFEGNSDIKSVSIPSGVTKIGQMAFADCTGISSVSLPSTLTSIGIGAFCGCTSLSSVSIPSGVTSIGDDAFADCSSLSSVTIPSGVTSIGENAFGGCGNITIKCSEGSAAHDYAVENSINYELV